MLLFLHHGDRVVDGRGWWFPFFGGILPALLFLALLGVAIWAVIRLTGTERARASAPAASIGWRDGALEEVRFRYARGEISREEFVQRSRDLGAAGPDPGPASPRPDQE